MKTNYFGAAIAAVAAFLVPMAVHAQGSTAGWAALSGQPNISVGKSAAIYIWRTDNHIFVETTNDNPKGDLFTGRVRIDGGEITDDSGMGLENTDHLYRQSHNTISLRFHTSTASDQVEFAIRGGYRLDCDFAKNGSRSVPVYYGSSATQAATNPIFFTVKDGAIPTSGSGVPTGSGSSTGFAEPFSAASGDPHVQVGKVAGFYIFHVGNTVTVQTTNSSANGRMFLGTVTVNGGKITGTHAMGLEGNDKFSQPSANTLTFRFNTQNETDGIQFQLVGASTINFSLSSPGNPAAQVYVGENATPMNRDNLTFQVGR